MSDQTIEHIAQTEKTLKDLNATMEQLWLDSDSKLNPLLPTRRSRERSCALTKIQEAIMWLEEDLKQISKL